MIRLIVNADDFGWSRDVNDGIVYSHRDGILTATTLMAGGVAFDHAVELARATPSLDVGVHLTLLHTPSVLTGAMLPSDVAALLQAVVLRQIDVYAEFAAQVRKIVSAGISPSHLDTHKHTHVLPVVASAVARIVREFGIRWVRMPFDSDASGGLTARLMRTQAWGIRRKLRAAGALTTDHFAGFAATGFLDEERLLAIVDGLREGTTELMCHPGFCRAELLASRTRLKASREVELRALTSARVRERLAARGVVLEKYRDTI
jgi:chitin disaccharide deacetylase